MPVADGQEKPPSPPWTPKAPHVCDALSMQPILAGMAAGVLGWRQQLSQNQGCSYSVVKGVYTEYGVHGRWWWWRW